MKRSQAPSHAAQSQKRARMPSSSADGSSEVADAEMPAVADEDARELSGAADEHKDRDDSDDGDGDDSDEHREELGSHDDEDTESADDDVAAVADDSVHDAGLISRIEIENFMCHTNFTLSLNRNVNFVTGRNGSGKSAILAALQLCLGARAGDTHRGKSLKDLIRQGHTGSAYLRVTLRNGGSEAYRPDEFGDKITVERTINRSGGGTYNLKSAKNKVVSRRKADLVEMLDHLNIQVDNPCCVLGQTDAKEFLNAASKKEGGDLYRFFLRATDLERLKRKHMEQKEGKESMAQKLEAAQPMLLQWREKLVKAQKAWEECASLDTLEKQLVEHKLRFVWAELEEKEHEVSRQEQQQSKEKERVDILQGKLDAKVTEKEANGQKQSEVTAQLGAISERVRAIENERKALQKKVQKVKRPLEVAQQTEKRETSKIHKLTSVLAARERKLQTLRETAKRDAEKKDVERIERRERAEHALKAAQEHLKQLNTAETADNDATARLSDELDNLRRQEHSAEQNLRTANQELLRLKTENGDQLGKYGRNIPKLMRLIDEHERDFECKPLLIGPALRLLDEYRSWARTIEYVLGMTMKSILVTSHADKAVLNKLRRAAGCDRGEGEALILRNSSQRYTINQVDRTLLTVERALQVDTAWVYNALVDTRSIESHVLFETRQECLQKIIIGDGRNARMPRYVKSGIMKNCSRMLARAGNTVDYPAPQGFPLRGYFGASESVEVRISAEEQRCAQHQNSLRQFAADKREREGELKRLKGAQRQHDTRVRKAQAEVRRASDALRSTTELGADDDDAADLAEMEELQVRIEDARQDIEDAKVEVAQSQAQVTQLQTELDPLEQQQLAQEDDTTIQDESVACEEKLEALINEAGEINAKHAEYDRKLRHYQSRLKDVAEDLKLTRAEVRAQLEKAEQYTLKNRAGVQRDDGDGEVGGSASAVERVDTHGKSKDQIHQAIAQCMKRIDREKQRRGVVDAAEIKRELEMTEKQVARRERNIEKIKADIERLKKGMRARRGKYTDFRKHIGRITGSLFRKNVLNRKLYGRLSFDHKTRSLTMDVTKAGADASSQVSNVAMLSGGERSFTTASFLLALWQSIECPFRVLDEFDVYMDQINRQASLLMLQNMALNEKSNNQFIFITPNSVAGVNAEHPQVSVFRLDDPRDSSGMHQTTLVGASSS